MGIYLKSSHYTESQSGHCFFFLLLLLLFFLFFFFPHIFTDILSLADADIKGWSGFQFPSHFKSRFDRNTYILIFSCHVQNHYGIDCFVFKTIDQLWPHWVTKQFFSQLFPRRKAENLVLKSCF